MAITNLTEEILTAALEGLEARKRRIQETESEVRRLMGGAAPSSGVTRQDGRRFMSAETRARMAEAQRRRWAKTRGEAPAAVTKAAPKAGKRKLSAAGRKAISEAAKKRWAAIRAAAA